MSVSKPAMSESRERLQEIFNRHFPNGAVGVWEFGEEVEHETRVSAAERRVVDAAVAMREHWKTQPVPERSFWAASRLCEAVAALLEERKEEQCSRLRKGRMPADARGQASRSQDAGLMYGGEAMSDELKKRARAELKKYLDELGVANSVQEKILGNDDIAVPFAASFAEKMLQEMAEIADAHHEEEHASKGYDSNSYKNCGLAIGAAQRRKFGLTE